MEMYIGKQISAQTMMKEIKSFGLHCLMRLPGADRVRGALTSSFLKLLFVPVLFALSTYASDYSEVQSLRVVLDPVVHKIPGVEGSMIGACVYGTDKDPFSQKDRGERHPVDMCLVYFVKDESTVSRIRKTFKNLNLNTSVAIRFQKT